MRKLYRDLAISWCSGRYTTPSFISVLIHADLVKSKSALPKNSRASITRLVSADSKQGDTWLLSLIAQHPCSHPQPGLPGCIIQHCSFAEMFQPVTDCCIGTISSFTCSHSRLAAMDNSMTWIVCWAVGLWLGSWLKQATTMSLTACGHSWGTCRPNKIPWLNKTPFHLHHHCNADSLF